jgi:hypothetical protein
MIKHVLLFCSMFMALPVMADKLEPIDLPPICSSAGHSASFVMANLYSVNPELVSVRIVSASKLSTAFEVVTMVQTNYRGEECQMEWTSRVHEGVLACLPDLISLSCNTVNGNIRAADEQLERKMREALRSKPETKKEVSLHE